LDYENSASGSYLKDKDEDARVRALMRSKNIDSRSNAGFNLVNGLSRMSVDVPLHKLYNPDGSANYMNSKSKLRNVGNQIMSPHRGDGP
jgi:hypothetical protein